MKDKEYIQWLEERIVRLEVDLYEAKKQEFSNNTIAGVDFTESLNQLNNLL